MMNNLKPRLVLCMKEEYGDGVSIMALTNSKQEVQRRARVILKKSVNATCHVFYVEFPSTGTISFALLNRRSTKRHWLVRDSEATALLRGNIRVA